VQWGSILKDSVLPLAHKEEISDYGEFAIIKKLSLVYEVERSIL
jgi:hypothetical protein